MIQPLAKVNVWLTMREVARYVFHIEVYFYVLPFSLAGKTTESNNVLEDVRLLRTAAGLSGCFPSFIFFSPVVK